ncbi:DUF956 domain-containing protein, partial [Streptococcus suis]
VKCRFLWASTDSGKILKSARDHFGNQNVLK